MTKYREILREKSLGLSQQKIADGCKVSKKTVNKVLKRATELGISWPLSENRTDQSLEELLFPKKKEQPEIAGRLPDYDYVHKELLRNGVTKKLLWTEYLNDCAQNNQKAFMYSQFCYYIQQDEEQRRATMHLNHKPGEQLEVDWTGDPAYITERYSEKQLPVCIFVGVLSFSGYAYVEAFLNEKTKAWITAHIHMYEYFGGVTRILIPDNCRTAVNHNGGWYSHELNKTYHEMAEHYGTAVIPARVRTPKDKPKAEGTVGNISTWIIAALRNEQFFSLSELNKVIFEKLEEYNARNFQKKEGSRKSLFLTEEKPVLLPLPTTRYETAEWKTATVQFNYHISLDRMLYSVPFQYIHKKVDVRITFSTVEIFFEQKRIASHVRLYGRSNQYSTQKEHMPKDHQFYLEWDGERFRSWASKTGTDTYKVVDALLRSYRVEQQAYRSCMGLLKLADKYSSTVLENACSTALEFSVTPSFKSIQNIILTRQKTPAPEENSEPSSQSAITRGADYYRRQAE
jgi:transposase